MMISPMTLARMRAQKKKSWNPIRLWSALRKPLRNLFRALPLHVASRLLALFHDEEAEIKDEPGIAVTAAEDMT